MGDPVLKPSSLALPIASAVAIGLLSHSSGAIAAPAAASTDSPCASFEAVAHRGFHPPGVDENTVGSFRAATASNFSIETDVWSDSEGVLWMFHDRSTRRSTGVRGFIDEMTTKEVTGLRYKDTGSRIPTFDRAMAQWSSTPTTRVFVEVKKVEDVLAVADRIRQAGRIETTFLTSFTPYTARNAPDMRTLWKIPGWVEDPDPSMATDLGADVVALPWPSMTRDRVDRFRAAGVEVQGFNSNASSRWAKAIKAGADGQLTGSPAGLRQFCRQYISPPRVSGVVPAAAGSQTVVIRGRNLGTTKTVLIAGIRARQLIAAPRRIELKLPARVGRAAKVKVVTPAGTDVMRRVQVRQR